MADAVPDPQAAPLKVPPSAPQVEGLKAVADTTKQIIALSTGVIALTVTFFDTFRAPAGLAPGAGALREVPTALVVAWGLLGLATVAGVWTLQAVTGTLDALDRRANGQALRPHQAAAAEAMAYGTHVRIPALVMDVAFLLGVVLTVVGGLTHR